MTDSFHLRHPNDLYSVIENLHEPVQLQKTGFPDRVFLNDTSPVATLTRYLSLRSTFEKGRKLIYMETEKDAPTLKLLQKCLRKNLGTRGIAIEVNPSSNLLIGHLGDMHDHPLWRIMPVIEGDEHPVSLCIGTDDPLTFATDMLSEYQLVADSLGRLGFTENQCDAWIEKARLTGLRNRFTLPVDMEPSLLNIQPFLQTWNPV